MLDFFLNKVEKREKFPDTFCAWCEIKENENVSAKIIQSSPHGSDSTEKRKGLSGDLAFPLVSMVQANNAKQNSTVLPDPSGGCRIYKESKQKK